MTKAGERLLAAAQELHQAVKNDAWSYETKPSGVVVMRPVILMSLAVREFELLLSGHKQHHICPDLGLESGDFVEFQEAWIDDEAIPTGRRQRVEVTYVTSDEFPCALSGSGLTKGFSILSIKKVEAPQLTE